MHFLSFIRVPKTIQREEKELAKCEAENIGSATIHKREALESMEARERELEVAKREYENLEQRHLDRKTTALAKGTPLPQFDRDKNLLSFDIETKYDFINKRSRSLERCLGRSSPSDQPAPQLRWLQLQAHEFEEYFDRPSKGQVSFTSFFSSLGDGTAASGAGGGAGAAGGLSGNGTHAARFEQVSTLLSICGFYFKLNEEFGMTDLDEKHVRIWSACKVARIAATADVFVDARVAASSSVKYRHFRKHMLPSKHDVQRIWNRPPSKSTIIAVRKAERAIRYQERRRI